MGTLEGLLPLLYDVDPHQESTLQVTPELTLGAFEAAVSRQDYTAATALLDDEIAKVRVILRLAESRAGQLVEGNPERPARLPLYLSDLHCRRARLLMHVNDQDAARHDLCAAQLLADVHPDAAPLLVEVYESLGRPDYAMSLLARVHREDPLSRAAGLLRLLVGARYADCPDTTVTLGTGLLTDADPWNLFADIIEEHRRWVGPPPSHQWFDDHHQQLVSAYEVGDWPRCRALVSRLLAWVCDEGMLWYVLGAILERESGAYRLTDIGGNIAVVDLPEDHSPLHAAADAFHLSAYFNKNQLDPWLALSRSRLALGDSEAAAIAADRALAVEARNVEAHWLLALALIGLEDAEGALQEIFKLLEIDPTFEPARRLIDTATIREDHSNE